MQFRRKKTQVISVTLYLLITSIISTVRNSAYFLAYSVIIVVSVFLLSLSIPVRPGRQIMVWILESYYDYYLVAILKKENFEHSVATSR